MIVPIRCFTCGKPITHANWEEYVKMTTNTDEDSVKKTQARHAAPTTARPFGHKADLAAEDTTLEYMALNILNVKRMCCRRMYLGTIDIFDKL